VTGEKQLMPRSTMSWGSQKDKNGNYFVSDLDIHRIRMINPRGEISTIAGTGIAGYNGDGIPASRALIFSPAHMQFDPSGNLVFADSGNCLLRRIDSRGIITTIAGNGTCGYSGDGGPATAASVGTFYGIAFDGSGNLYLADLVSSVVRMVDTHGMIHTFAGNGTAGYSGDGGPATAAQLGFPIGLVAESSGNMYIADETDSVVRKVDPLWDHHDICGQRHEWLQWRWRLCQPGCDWHPTWHNDSRWCPLYQ
jgi:sugar lactone lactonase YvrE